ncbi:MAG: Fic family protein [bacterium]
MSDNQLKMLPATFDFESIAILKQLAKAHRYLAELKGVSKTIPNQDILINTLALQEAKDSSAIENIITTNDDLFMNELGEAPNNAAAKEVRDYAMALRMGFKQVATSRLITVNNLVDIYQQVKKTDAGIRRLPGTELRNGLTGETVYVPPQNHDEITALLTNLERYINDDSLSAADPLVKMAVIHYQFESIHPFTDGNGRTGRILNVLYLVLKELLDIPVLYLSRYIITRKSDYYRLLQKVRDEDAWEEWILFMLAGIEQTSRQTITIVQRIGHIMGEYKHRIRTEYPKIYSQELLNNLFFHPYTRIDFLMKDLEIARLTATKYLETLTNAGLLHKVRIGSFSYYINIDLFALLANIPAIDEDYESIRRYTL